MRDTAYVVVDAIPVVYLERRPQGRQLSVEELSNLVYRYVVASTALYRYAKRVAGEPSLN